MRYMNVCKEKTSDGSKSYETVEQWMIRTNEQPEKLGNTYTFEKLQPCDIRVIPLYRTRGQRGHRTDVD